MEVARGEKSVFARRYFGMGSGRTDGVGIMGSIGGAEGVDASAGCVYLCSLKQGREQLEM